MLFSIANDRRYYGSDIVLSSATKKRYVLEEYPSRIRSTPEYNPLYDTFQSGTLSYINPQFQDRRTNVNDRPYTHYFDNEQPISSYNRNVGEK